MKINIYKIPFGYFTSREAGKHFEINAMGHLETDKFDADDCWHWCNWSCWTPEHKPEHLKSEIAVANSDVVFELPNGECWLAKPKGWHQAESLDGIKRYCENYWMKERFEEAVKNARSMVELMDSFYEGGKIKPGFEPLAREISTLRYLAEKAMNA